MLHLLFLQEPTLAPVNLLRTPLHVSVSVTLPSVLLTASAHLSEKTWPSHLQGGNEIPYFRQRRDTINKKLVDYTSTMHTGDYYMFDSAVLCTSLRMLISLLKCWISIIPNLHGKHKPDSSWTYCSLLLDLVWVKKKNLCFKGKINFQSSLDQKMLFYL